MTRKDFLNRYTTVVRLRRVMVNRPCLNAEISEPFLPGREQHAKSTHNKPEKGWIAPCWQSFDAEWTTDRLTVSRQKTIPRLAMCLSKLPPSTLLGDVRDTSRNCESELVLTLLVWVPSINDRSTPHIDSKYLVGWVNFLSYFLKMYEILGSKVRNWFSGRYVLDFWQH